MKHTNKHLSTLLAVVALLCITACGHNRTNKPSENSQSNQMVQDVRLAPGDYLTDIPDNVVEYFQTLCQEHGAVVALHSGDQEDSLSIWHTVSLLDDYASGRRKYYPADEVRKALDALVLNLGYWYSHGGYFDYDDVDTDYAEMFFFRFLEQAVRLSPQIDYVTDFHSADGTAGILNFHEWSPNPLYSFLVYPTDDGLRVRKVGETGDTKIEKLFHLTDDAGREYYLCSNNGDLNGSDDYYGVAFRQFLYLRDGDNMREVASYVGPDFPPAGFEGKVVFNPRLLRWDCCEKNGNTYVRIEGTQSLQLILDGEKSRFYLEYTHFI